MTVPLSTARYTKCHQLFHAFTKYKRRALPAQTAQCRSKVYYLVYSTFIILGPTKDSGREDKSFAEKSGN